MVFEPAYLAITGGTGGDCDVSYSLDGAPAVALSADVVLEVPAGTRTVHFSASAQPNPNNCNCSFGPNADCQVSAKKGKVATIHLRAERGDLCRCDILFCYYDVLMIAECPQ